MRQNNLKPGISKAISGAISRSGDGRSRLRAFWRTVRGQIIIAFLGIVLITAALGGYAAWGIKNAGLLVDKTYDEILMSTNHARAAAAEFAAMRAAVARSWIATDPAIRAALDGKVQKLAKTLEEELTVAEQRSQTERAKNAAANAKRAIAAWKDISERRDADWAVLDRYASKAEEQINLLIDHMIGDGILYRESARSTVVRNMLFNMAGTALAVVLSGLLAWALMRRIVGPLTVASNVAAHIATGRIDVAIPKGGADELGGLLASMELMRNNLKSMMEREVALRRSAQTRLAGALESSQEGIVVVDANDQIALANAQAANFLGVSQDQMAPGVSIAELLTLLDGSVDVSGVLMRPGGLAAATSELQLKDGRWLRVSRNGTRDGGFIVVCSDVSSARQQKAHLRDTNLRLDAALENMSQGLCMFDADGQLEVVNRRFFEIFQLPRDRIRVGATYREVLQLSVGAGHRDGTSADRLLEEEARFKGPNGGGTQYYELQDGRVIAGVYSPASNGGWVATYEDVTERHRAEAKIMHMARHDALTNLPNRLLFRETMEEALARGEGFAVLFLDLDRFKAVNDTLGHSVGDALLCAVTRRLQLAVRGTDTVARLGGDEFAIIQMGGQSDDASDLAGRIIEAISETFHILKHQVAIGTSMGIAMAPDDGSEPDQLLRHADMALYRAKGEGRGKYHFFQPDMDAKMQERHALELDLRKALLGHELELHYQPIVDLAANKICGFEALARWKHPVRGMILPDVFIPVAEEIGLIGPLGDWLLRQACYDAVKWPDKLSVAVNLSAVQFRNPALVLSVTAALGASGLDARRLELEITESVLLQDDRTVMGALHEMRDLGVRISMDDFGTGYSSLSCLRSFPFDKIKIDRSFTRELGKKNDSIAIIQAVTQLGKGLGMVTTAEGIETKEQLKILRAEGCSQGQGDLFSKPKPTAQIPAMLRKINQRHRAA